jgi:hypothetical protein
MQIVRKQWAFQTGYDIHHDLIHGFQLHLGHRVKKKPGEPVYRVSIFAQWDWPKLVWRSATWAVNEAGYVRGMPVLRQGRLSRVWKAITGREHYLSGILWDRIFHVYFNR